MGETSSSLSTSLQISIAERWNFIRAISLRWLKPLSPDVFSWFFLFGCFNQLSHVSSPEFIWWKPSLGLWNWSELFIRIALYGLSNNSIRHLPQGTSKWDWAYMVCLTIERYVGTWFFHFRLAIITTMIMFNTDHVQGLLLLIGFTVIFQTL